MEIWKDVTGFEDAYSISNMGNLISKSRLIYNSNSTRRSKEKYIKCHVDGGGYKFCMLSQNKFKKRYKIHRLVAIMFIDNKCSYNQVNHKNGIKTDNRVENLEWCNNSMNIKHAYDNGLCINHKLSVGIKVINELTGVLYLSITDAANENNIPIRNLCRYLRNTRKNKTNLKIWEN